MQGGRGGTAGSVLLVGNPSLPLKGFDVAIRTLAAVNRVLPISLTWICQTQPTAASVPALLGSGLTLDLHVSPSQEDLPALYRGHDVFLFTSRYEAWGMPVLEAMASGLAVVATRCLGVDGFAHHLTNCLLADPLVRHLPCKHPLRMQCMLAPCSCSGMRLQDVAALVRGVLTVLLDSQVRQHMQAAGRETALRFSPGPVADRWCYHTHTLGKA